MGRDLLARSLAFQACFLSAAAVAARFGAATVAAHQVVLQLWFFMALVLDAVAIAAQSLVGAALGGGDVPRARALARQVARLRAGARERLRRAVRRRWPGCCRACSPAIRRCWRRCRAAWWFFVAMQPLAGVVFALDGVLLGAGDAAYLRTSTLARGGGRVPAADLGVAGVRLGAGRASGRA